MLIQPGVTGILKNWWKNYIQEEERNKIRTHTNSQGQLDNIETRLTLIENSPSSSNIQSEDTPTD